MADEDKDWNPEDENTNEDLLREHNKLAREMLDLLKTQKEGKREDEAKEDLARLQERVSKATRSAPVSLGVYRAPPLLASAERLRRIWLKVKELLGDAPNEIQTIAFQNLLHTSDDEPLGVPALEATEAIASPDVPDEVVKRLRERLSKLEGPEDPKGGFHIVPGPDGLRAAPCEPPCEPATPPPPAQEPSPDEPG
jgi:hypothetical protein